jgi:transcriptional regulator with XRE-family HTH domain
MARGGETVLGQRIKQLRRQKLNITQEQLAEKMGVSKSTISQWESNTNEPNVDALIKLADLFGVTVDYLIGRDNYSEEERNFLRDIDELTPEDLIEKYHLKIGDREATREEIVEMVNYIKARRIMKMMHD